MKPPEKPGQGSLFGGKSTHDDPAAIADAALLAIRAAARRFELFTTDEVADELTDWRIKEPRVLGTAMKRARKAGWIEKTKEWRETSNRVAHRRSKQVWRSKLVPGSENA